MCCYVRSSDNKKIISKGKEREYKDYRIKRGN